MTSSARGSEAIVQMRILAPFQLPELSFKECLHFTFPHQRFFLELYTKTINVTIYQFLFIVQKTKVGSL